MVDDEDHRDVRDDPSHRPEGEGLSLSSDGGPKHGLPPCFRNASIDLKRRCTVERNDGVAALPGGAPAGGDSLETSEEAVPPLPRGWLERLARSARIRRLTSAGGGDVARAQPQRTPGDAPASSLGSGDVGGNHSQP